MKIYKNSECEMCLYEYQGELKVKEDPNTGKKIICCRECFTKLYNGKTIEQVKRELRSDK